MNFQINNFISNVVCLAKELEKTANPLQPETNRLSGESNHYQDSPGSQSSSFPPLNQNNSSLISSEISHFNAAIDLTGK